MKIKFPVFILIISVLFQNLVFSNTVQYLSPMPGSKYNSEQTNILIGFSNQLSANAFKSITLKVEGLLSGLHSGNLLSVSNNTRVIYETDEPFELGEKVTVSGYDGKNKFSFYIRNEKISFSYFIRNELNYPKNDDRSSNYGYTPYRFSTDSLPNLIIINNGPTAPGYIFILNFANNSSITSYCMILNNNGTPKYSRLLGGNGFDFKKQNSHLLTYYDEIHQKYLGLNDNYVVVDSFSCGNGYNTDFHELRVLGDGSSWLMSYDPQYIDMSKIVPGGNVHTLVTGLIVQHINAQKNVIFQWRSWDHFQITDATHENLLASNIDYVHGNAIEIDTDSNIIISSRHMDEITKINSTTGDIIWRLGGKNNQFVFSNDSIGFSHQHCIRRLENQNLLLFDNGNYHTPAFSRAIEYQINETNKTVNLVWQYIRTPSIYASAMGSVQRLSNGNTLIGWGSASPTLTEVTPEGNIAYELLLPSGQMSYRAFRFEWQDNVTDVHQKINLIPSKYCLYQNFPNPFNPITNIRYDITKNGFVKLMVFDMLGREIETLVNEKQSTGTYEATFDASNYPSGVYFYRLTTDGFNETKKMVLIK